MKRFAVLFGLALLLAACARPAVPAATPTPKPQAAALPTAGVQVPYDFEIDLYQGQDALGATQIHFSDAFDGSKPVVVMLWAGLCPTCRRELPVMQKAYKTYGDRVNFIGLDVGRFTDLGTETSGRALLQKYKVTFPAGGPTKVHFMHEYRILGTPSSIFFSADGEVVHHWAGLISAKQLNAQIEALLDS